MKNLASLLLALLLVVSLPLFTSCNKSAYRTYVDAYEKTNALDSLDARMDIKTKMEMSGDSFEVPISYDIKATGIRTESPEFTAVMTFSMLGMEMSFDIYCDSQYFYISGMGEKVKMSVEDTENSEGYDILALMDDLMIELPEELFENQVFVDNPDGTKSLEMTVSEEKFNELYSDLEEQIANSAAEDSEIKNVSNIKIKLTVDKDGYLLGYDLSFVMYMVISMMDTVIITADCSVVINNPGKKVTVTPPEDLSSYKESDDPLAGVRSPAFIIIF